MNANQIHCRWLPFFAEAGLEAEAGRPLADPGLPADPGLEADPGLFVADPGFLVAEPGFSGVQLWSLPLAGGFPPPPGFAVAPP